MILLLISNLLLPQGFSAELTLDAVLGESLKRLPLILEASEKVRAASSAQESATGAFDHKIKVKTLNQFEDKYDNQMWDARLERQTPYWGSRFFLGQRQGTGVYPIYDGKSETSSIGELFAGVEVPLLRDRAMDEPRLELARATQRLESERISFQQKSLEVMFKAGASYWKWVAATKKLDIIERWTRIAEERQDFLEKKVRAGDQSEIKLVDNRRSLTKRRAELVKAQREHEQSTAQLALYIGADLVKRENAPVDIPISDDPTALPSTQQRDGLPSFRLLAVERSLLEQEKAFAAALRLPELRLGVEGARDLGQLPPSQSDPDQLRVGLRLEIPLENRKGEGKFAEVNAKQRALNARRDWLEREWNAFVSQNAIAIRTTREQLALLELETSDSERMARAELSRLKQGDSDVFFVNLRSKTKPTLG